MPISQGLGWACVRASLLLLAFTAFSFGFQPDPLAAFTVLPIWLWSGIGIALSLGAFYYANARFSLWLSAAWLVTALVGSEESRTLLTARQPETLLPGPALPQQTTTLIRVATLNCAVFGFGNPGNELVPWHPDIVLLQDTYPSQVRALSQTLHAGQGHHLSHNTNGIVSRWTIKNPVNTTHQRNQQACVSIPNFGDLVAINVHLISAATDLRLWNPSAWTQHRNNRILRRKELTGILTQLKQTTKFPLTPTLLGGDFNAASSDPIYHLLKNDFVDSFNEVGTSWGNTYPSRFPIIRIDQLYASKHLIPIHSRCIETRHSDHRLVITDYLLTNQPKQQATR
jgi:endonuclease/exonuclease/phosphatase (EEP) superfamily protein YafD